METIDTKEVKYWVQQVNRIPMQIFEERYNEMTYGLPLKESIEIDQVDRKVFNEALNELRNEQRAQLN